MSKPLIDRAMRIMNALLKDLLARGYTTANESRYHSNATIIRGYGHEFGVRSREPSVMVQRMDEFYGRMRTEYDPSGRIQLEVEGFGAWTPKVVRDGRRSTIENRIGDLPAQMLQATDAARRKEAEWEAEERRREAERQAKWETEERAKEAARLAAAKKRREIALFKRSRPWKRCGDLRECIEAVRQLTAERPLPEGARQEAAEWIEWATGVADAYDLLATWGRATAGTGPEAAVTGCRCRHGFLQAL